MRIIVSPTKKMKIDDSLEIELTTPVFLKKTEQLLAYLQSLTYDQLKTLFQCNDKIAKENYERYENMDIHNAYSIALLSYDGIAFQYMAPHIFTKSQLEYIHSHLRIISAFYGVLKPFDKITPYRLEMQAKLNAPFSKTLYDFWKEHLYEEIIDDSQIVVNLASNEYSKAIRPYLKDSDLWVDVVFGELKGNKVVEKGVYVKMARGEMVRFMAENNVKNPEEMKRFNGLGYHYNDELSTKTKYVFIKGEEHEKSN